ncbi:MAG: dihydrofolate reductase [Bacillota bacterium]|nr:dihydrofolate reductase [Bacillota bacterium]
MNFIVSVDDNWAIGRGGQLLARIPEDMRFFRYTTGGGAVVMGDVTWASLPEQARPLPERLNIVLSDRPEFAAEGAVTVHSFEELRALLREIAERQEIFVIGGAAVYRLLMDYCQYAYITRLYHAFDADKHIPSLDDDARWRLLLQTPRREHNGLEYSYCLYHNSAALSL